MKKRFRILLLAPEYKKDKVLQGCIPSALISIHNFIRLHDPDEEKLPGLNTESILPHAGDTSTPLPTATQSAAAARRDVDNRRDTIAQAMWDSYQEIISTHSEQDEQIYLHNNIEHPYITRLLGNMGGNTEQEYVEDGDDNEDNEEEHNRPGEGDADENNGGNEGNAVSST